MSVENVEKLIKDNQIEFIDLRFVDMQAIENPAGTVQASSHYACGSCEGAQAEAGVRNATGAASQNGGKVTRPINPPETPSRLHPRPRKRTSE